MNEYLFNFIKVIKSFEDNLSYLIRYNANKAIVIDPGAPETIMNAINIEKIQITHIFNTHNHYDHIAGNSSLQKETNCQIMIPKGSGIRNFDHELTNDEIIELDNLNVQVISTPGHTDFDISFLINLNKDDNSFLFTGDFIFIGGCGRVFSNNYHLFYNSIEKIKKEKNSTYIFPGHEYSIDNYNFALSIEPENVLIKKSLQKAKQKYNMFKYNLPSTIQHEKKTNIFFKSNDKDVANAIKENSNSPVEIFKKLRQKKDFF